jgi:F-type H+-transporting ATPase subunit b
VETLAATFGVDWPHLTAQIVSFSIVCALLYWLAYTPVLRMLAVRRAQIAQGIADAEKIDAALAAVEATRQEVLAAARADSARLVADARESARRLKEQEAGRAMVAAEQIVARAREAAAQERLLMHADLRREIGHLVVQTTAAVSGKVLTDDDQRRLAEATVLQLASS